jgi:hypothetical protein
MIGFYVNALAIKRQPNVMSTCLADSEDENDEDCGAVNLADM